MVSLEFVIHMNLPAELWPFGVDSASKRNISRNVSLGV